MKITTLLGIILAADIALGFATSTSASTLSFSSPSGTTLSNGRPVDAQAIIATSANTVTVTLSNLQVGIKDITQTISGVSFALDNLATGTTITSSAGLERTVNSNLTFSDGLTVPTGWEVVLDGQSMQLMLPDSVLTHTIIGPASGTKYTGANSTIAGSSDNNPFLIGPVTFVINVPGATAASKVDWAVFHFGTCAEYVTSCQGTPVPEPATLGLATTGLACAALALWRRRRLHKQA